MRSGLLCLMIACMVVACEAQPEGAQGQASASGTSSSDVSAPVKEADASSTEENVDAAVSGPGSSMPDAAPSPECAETSAERDCQDYDPCTLDTCVAAQCQNTPIIGCCREDSDCDDGVACTLDQCNVIKNECIFVREDNHCCFTAEDCDDGESCTSDLCAANRCIYLREHSDACACVVDSQCDDGNDCSVDLCQQGVCDNLTQAGPGCCLMHTDCDDEDPATYDSCQQGRCWNKVLACAIDADCVNPDGCVTGQCLDGSCDYEAVAEDCCTVSSDCDDGFAETIEHCVMNRCVSSVGASPSLCASDTDCAGSECISASCHPSAGVCHEVPVSAEGCCVLSEDCPSPADPCVVASCEAFSCQEQALPGLSYWQELWASGELSAWEIETDFSGAYWHLSEVQAISTPWSLYYGHLTQNNYAVGHTMGAARSPVITVPDDGGDVSYQLSFWFSADIEPLVSVDHFWLELIQDDGVTELWNKSDSGGPGIGWRQVIVPLPPSLTSFQLAIRFDSIDETNNNGQGIFIDDIHVERVCE